jgi:hypothetical protein
MSIPISPLKSTAASPFFEIGRKTALNTEHPSNAPPSIRHSFEAGSNRTSRSLMHLRKQEWDNTSMDRGSEMDESREHVWNAPFPIERSFEPDSNSTKRISPHNSNDPTESTSISRRIVTRYARPKYRISDVPSELSKKLPQARKW